METKHALLTLAETLANHQGVTHYAISMRALGKGDFFANLMKEGRDCQTRTAHRLMNWFSQNWSDDDLEWPQDIPRPNKSNRKNKGRAA